MKKLLVWLACASMCAAQTVSIGPFATEDWVDERLQVLTNDLATVPYVDDAVGEVEDKIPDVSVYATKSYVNAVSNAIPDVSGLATKEYVDAVSNAIPDISGLATVEYVDAVSNAIPDTSAFSTVEYVNTTSNNLALLIDDLVSEEELGSSVSNIVPAWALVPVPPVTAEVDPAFTNWLATTNVVIDDNVGAFVSNVVPSWALVPIPPVTVEVDPAFTNWLATTNSATVQYVDDHQWDWLTQVTNAPAFAPESIQLPPDHTAFTLRYVPNGYRTFYYDGTKSTVGLFMVDNKGDPYISACNGQYARLIDPVFLDSNHDGFEDINGTSVRVDTAAFFPTYFLDDSNRFLWLTTNGVLKAGTIATVEDISREIAGKQDALVFDEQGRGVGVGWHHNYPWLYVSGTGTNTSYIGFDGSVNAIVTQDGSYLMPPTSGTLVSDSSLATVAFTGSYSDLSGAPDVTDVSKDSDGRLYIEGYDVAYYIPESITYEEGNMSYWCLTLDNNYQYYPLVQGKVINQVPILTFGKGASEVPVPVVKGSYDPFENDPTDFYLTIPAYDPGMPDSATSHVFHVDLGAYTSTNDVVTLLSDKVSLDAIAPLFSTNNVYTNGDFVVYNTHMYECTNAQSGAWVQGNWKQTSVAEILGNLRRILDAINGEML